MKKSSLPSLLQDGQDISDEIASTMIQVADHILKNRNGSVAKCCFVRINSKAIEEKLFPHESVAQCLLKMGFQKDDCERFSFSEDTNIDNLKAIRDQLEKHRRETVTSPEIIRSQQKILGRLKAHFQHSQIYESKTLQEKAKSLIPVVQLQSEAEKRLKKISDTTSGTDAPSLRYCLLMELRAWYRSFFSWTDAPKCTNCKTEKKAKAIGRLHPTAEDIAWDAHTVEAYRCPVCATILRYPRYNHPGKLLDTRTGRCGEWANCFTLLCRAMDFEARHVLDWTDHVWNEVFIPEWNRWIHCDHGNENCCDNPLMYEQGWKKKLSLIVAASAEEVVDVTWRYSVDRQGVGERRSAMFEERWLEATLKNLNNTMSIAVTPERKQELIRRRQEEMKELGQIKDVGGKEYEGRTTGSLEWRLARGETHGSATEPKRKMMKRPLMKPSDIF